MHQLQQARMKELYAILHVIHIYYNTQMSHIKQVSLHGRILLEKKNMENPCESSCRTWQIFIAHIYWTFL